MRKQYTAITPSRARGHPATKCHLFLLGATLAWEGLDGHSVELVWHRNLHLHLHGLKHTQWLTSLQFVTRLHCIGDDLTRHHAGKLLEFARRGLAWPRIDLRSDNSIWIWMSHSDDGAFMLESESDVTVGCFA